MASEPASKLAAAAEEFIKAAYTRVECSSVDSLKSSMDAKLNTLNQSILNLKKELAGMKNGIAAQTKNQKLQWAIDSVEVNSFLYYEKGSYNRVESSSFASSVLFSFRRGTGHYITNRSMTRYDSHRSHIEEGEEKFRDAFSKQIHELLGHEPRIAMADDGYAIYYS